ncbi:MAG: cobalamin B12-binding domain-containing protein, partial [Candidatus Omnitrophica bacterium]|nr:cobalamin B12-binding domain-containing protein [Candidatus Omnitrophota bacterium]
MSNRKIDIVLVNPPFSLRENFGLLDFAGQYGSPLNLLYLASSLEKSNINTKVIDLSYDEGDMKKCAEYIASINSDFVGVAVHFTFLVNKALKLISMIKSIKPEITTIVGGVHFTALPEETMNKCQAIDVGILGEGEEAIVEVIRSFKENKPPDYINGVIFRNKGKLTKVGNNNLVRDINKLPHPLFNKIDFRPYSFALYKERKSINFPLLTSRGCPFTCSFCDRTVLGTKVRFFEISYLSEMIDALVKEFKVDCFDVEDENICITKERFINICRLMKNKFIKYNLTWNCAMRLDSVDVDAGKMLYDAGCRSVTFGIESGS